MNYLFIYLSQLMGSLNIISSKILVSNTNIITLLALRFLIGSGILFVIYFVTNKTTTRIIFKSMQIKDWIFLVAQALCGGVLFYYFMYRGLEYAQSSIASIIMSSLPIIVSILGVIILKDKLSKVNKICIALVTLGLIIINFKQNSSGHNTQLIGVLLMLIAMLPEAFYYVLNRIYRISVPVYLMSAMVNLINGVILLPICYFDMIV